MRKRKKEEGERSEDLSFFKVGGVSVFDFAPVLNLKTLY